MNKNATAVANNLSVALAVDFVGGAVNNWRKRVDGGDVAVKTVVLVLVHKFGDVFRGKCDYGSSCYDAQDRNHIEDSAPQADVNRTSSHRDSVIIMT